MILQHPNHLTQYIEIVITHEYRTSFFKGFQIYNIIMYTLIVNYQNRY